MSIKVVSTTEAQEPNAAVVAAANSEAESTETESAPEETQGEITEESEASDENETEEGDEESVEGDRPKKKIGGFQKKIGKLTKQREDARKEADYWRQEALKYQKPLAEKPPEVEAKPKSDGKPTSDKFETHEDYVEALADWKVEQKLSARDQQTKQDSLKSEQEKQLKTFLSKREEFAKSKEDFFDRMEDIQSIPMSLTVNEALLTSDNGPELLYELAKDPEEYKRICSLPAISAARELGKFEARLSALTESSEALTTETKTSKAPAPIRPIGAKTTGGGKKSLSDPNLSQAEYEALRREQLAKKA